MVDNQTMLLWKLLSVPWNLVMWGRYRLYKKWPQHFTIPNEYFQREAGQRLSAAHPVDTPGKPAAAK